MPLLNKYELQHKKFLKAQLNLEQVRKELGDLPLQELKEPFQKGWEVTIRLRQDAARRSDADTMLEAIEIGYYKTSYISSLSHLKMLRAGEKGYWVNLGRQKLWRSFSPQTKRLKTKEYEILPERLQKFFCKHDDTSIVYGQIYTNIYYEVCLPEHYICLRARPNIITHFRLKGGPLEKKEAELKKFLDTYWREWFSNGKYGNKHGRIRSEAKAQIRKVLKGEKEEVYVDFKSKD